MLSINTNLSSLIAQSSMKSSTNILNQAVERMTTGYKINRASDNAANYSIATNMQTQISSYDVAADNVAMGMDLVNTANDIVSAMQDKATRLRALSTQARNGTYGAQSMAAINTEAAAIMAEINRLYSTAEYNGISLFNSGPAYTIASHLPQAGSSGFIEEPVATFSLRNAAPEPPTAKAEYNGFIEDPVTYEQSYVDGLKAVSEVSGTFTASEYKIAEVADLVRLAELTNSGVDTSGVTFILAKDLDLGAYCDAEIANGNGGWTPIGGYTNSGYKQFKGTFDGNGHVIKNLKIDRNDYCQGLFGSTYLESEIRNIGLEDVCIDGGGQVGGLVGVSNSTITNTYVTGTVSDTYSTTPTSSSNSVGGLVGQLGAYDSPTFKPSISRSYATATVKGFEVVGGLVGKIQSETLVTNSYATGAVSGSATVGGLAGCICLASSIANSYATGTVSGIDFVGGLVGGSDESNIANSYATGSVSGTEFVGGLVGGTGYYDSINNSYATGSVSGRKSVGGLVGQHFGCDGIIANSYSTGAVNGTESVGGLVGNACCAEGNVEISNSVSYSTVKGNNAVGALVGGVCGTVSYTWNYGDGDEGTEEISDGELLLTNCSAIANQDYVGGYYKEFYNNIYYEDPDTGDLIENYDYRNELDTSFDLSVYDANITAVDYKNVTTSLLVGINANSSCQLKFDMNFAFNISAIEADISSDSALATIDDFINQLSEQETKLGAVQNRLESALESISVNIENLTSSLSTIRDADISEVSATYIQQQILQQAAATLMSTANQSPAIALQLI